MYLLKKKGGGQNSTRQQSHWFDSLANVKVSSETWRLTPFNGCRDRLQPPQQQQGDATCKEQGDKHFSSCKLVNWCSSHLHSEFKDAAIAILTEVLESVFSYNRSEETFLQDVVKCFCLGVLHYSARCWLPDLVFEAHTILLPAVIHDQSAHFWKQLYTFSSNLSV